mmetsp:Transcript_59029/g.68996  ORF Transcript_59029/g.68996 Transcript_59029/m.68996 type:complete len:116 (-) Transcript_59029:167-514(-)
MFGEVVSSKWKGFRKSIKANVQDHAMLKEEINGNNIDDVNTAEQHQEDKQTAFDATQPNKRSTISNASDRPLRHLPLNIRAKKTRWGNVDIDQDLDADSFTRNSQKNHASTNCLK